MDPLISICIPTYNQHKEVERLLLSIKNQFSSEIEILIQDDSLNGYTKEVIEKFPYLNIKYYGRHIYKSSTGSGDALDKKGERGGIDRSIIYLSENALGEYVWWMGDDVLENGAIGRILVKLKNNPEIDFMWVNFRQGDMIGVYSEEDRFFKNKEEAIILLQGGLGFISGTLMRRGILIKGIERSKKFIGTAFVNLYLVLNVITSSDKLYMMKDPAVINFPNTPEEMNDNGFEVFGVYFYEILASFKDKFHGTALNRLVSENFRRVWKGMLVRWVTGFESPRRKVGKMLSVYWKYPEAWLASFLMLLPLWLNKFLFRIYKKLKQV